MAIFQKIFLEVFIVLYMLLSPLFSNPRLTTYFAILAIISGVAYANYRWLKTNGNKKGSIKFVFLFSSQVFFLAFLIWFVFIHFQSYKTMI